MTIALEWGMKCKVRALIRVVSAHAVCIQEVDRVISKETRRRLKWNLYYPLPGPSLESIKSIAFDVDIVARGIDLPDASYVQNGSSDSETNSEFDYPPPRPNQRRNVTFTLSQSRARNSESSPGHTTISGGTQSSVGGSQKVITDH
ncbi:hypothetical protein BT96DRAFT_939521 [Gymnopus androsaceus JB14]|uniref:Uncharacterized protein n=1 Tax=Gymnopus androsaceus JB14 TaxID=1447944 RepID=A0A6A4HQH5_9AGAR|nr:hypothetical protein BT96DRAFT_939521 [Gymnopus androsaceus JB14]